MRFEADKEIMLAGRFFEFHKLTEEDWEEPDTLDKLSTFVSIMDEGKKAFVLNSPVYLSKCYVGDWIVRCTSDSSSTWFEAPEELLKGIEEW